jgi:hypothetical protein
MTTDRTTLLRLASTLPKGSETRRAILAGLRRVAGSYQEYVKGLPKGKKPMDEDEWEARFGDGKKDEKGEKGKKPEGKSDAKPKASPKEVLDKAKEQDLSKKELNDLSNAAEDAGLWAEDISRLQSKLDKGELSGSGEESAKAEIKKFQGHLDKTLKDSGLPMMSADDFQSLSDSLHDLYSKKAGRQAGVGESITPHPRQPHRYSVAVEGYGAVDVSVDPSARGGSFTSHGSHPPEVKRAAVDAVKRWWRDWKRSPSSAPYVFASGETMSGETMSDRTTLLRLASTLPKGSETRRAILSGLRRVARNYQEYVKDLPKGKKPMDEDEWEARFGDGKKEKGKKQEEPKKEDPKKSWQKREQMAQDLADGFEELGRDFRTEAKKLGDDLDSSTKGALRRLTENMFWDMDEDEPEYVGDALNDLEDDLKTVGKAMKGKSEKGLRLLENVGTKVRDMRRNLKKASASDRKTLIRLASTLPKGSEERRAILSGLAKVAAINERAILKALKTMDHVPWTTNEIWAEIQTEFPKDAVMDWLSEGNEENYDWGDVEFLEDHPLMKKIENAQSHDNLYNLLEKLWKDGKLVRHRTRGGGGEWAIPGTRGAEYGRTVADWN